jgi:hypothetical protein
MRVHIGEVRKAPHDDPTNSGMCQVRLFNKQNDEQNVKDENLKWCPALQSTTSAATSGIGDIPAGMIPGTRVLVTYLEEDTLQQHPIIIGTLQRGELPYAKGLGKQQDPQSGGKIDDSKKGPDNGAPSESATGIYEV